MSKKKHTVFLSGTYNKIEKFLDGVSLKCELVQFYLLTSEVSSLEELERKLL